MWLTNSKTRYSIIIMLIDVLILNTSIILAFLIRFNFSLPPRNFEAYKEMFLWISIGSVFLFNIYHLYWVSPRTKWSEQFWSIVLAVLLTLMLGISLSYISANYAFPRSVFLISAVLQTILLTSWRYFLWKLSKKTLGIQKAIIIGSYSEALETADRLEKFSESHMNIAGIIIEGDLKTSTSKQKYEFLGNVNGFKSVLEHTDYDVVVVTSSLNAAVKEEIITFCFMENKEIFLVPNFYEVLLIKADLNLIDDIPIFTVQDSNGDENYIKRLFDLVLGLVALLLTLPVIIVIGFLIKLDSKGPIIYKQERITKDGKLFTLYKFRTMIHNAEGSTGPVLAAENDQRTTRIGRLLRLSRLDELPQFINVIKGEMSVVGPRPERPFFVKQYTKEIKGYENRHRMKPGITGIAQIMGKYNTGPREKLVLDLLYAKRNNILVDLQIILQTLKVLFLRDKAS